ncbi:hypothetical protein EVAR_35772_1 [Eumeta japonica]|uniref:Uncharacterized protein n=1 Tax=Eumeta variegata TaxID=151549 RepID=A0A4C1WNI8_EUMVA|nr:hypothetical protein EVAR_35772_1 [Eumeta japonica]
MARAAALVSLAVRPDARTPLDRVDTARTSEPHIVFLSSLPTISSSLSRSRGRDTSFVERVEHLSRSVARMYRFFEVFKGVGWRGARGVSWAGRGAAPAPIGRAEIIVRISWTEDVFLFTFSARRVMKRSRRDALICYYLGSPCAWHISPAMGAERGREIERERIERGEKDECGERWGDVRNRRARKHSFALFKNFRYNKSRPRFTPGSGAVLDFDPGRALDLSRDPTLRFHTGPVLNFGVGPGPRFCSLHLDTETNCDKWMYLGIVSSTRIESESSRRDSVDNHTSEEHFLYKATVADAIIATCTQRHVALINWDRRTAAGYVSSV